MAATLRPLRDPGVCGRRLPLAALLLLLTLPFLAQAQFEYSLENGAVWITGYTGPGGAVTIPDTINGLPVIAIGWVAFSENTSLTSVVIPEGVTFIDSGAFENCANLTNVLIPESITSIGWTAFHGCSSLAAITVDASNPAYSSLDGVLFNQDQTILIHYPAGRAGNYQIPDNVISLTDRAFLGCTSLFSVTIPASVALLEASVFQSCTSLKAIEVDFRNPAYSSLEGVLFNKGQTTLIRYPEGKSESYTVPDGITSIGSGAFSGCTSLPNLTLPASVLVIGNYAFAGCGSLTNIMLPHTLASIGTSTFRDCLSLTGVVIPNSVTRIEWSAFSGCTSLTSITIPSGVTSIEQSAFYGCTSLLAIDVDAENASYASLDGVLFSRDRTTLIQCPGGKVENYTVPEGVTRINEGAFNGCVHLTTITVEAGNTAYSSRDGILFDLSHTNLVRCPGGRTGNFTIPDGVTTIAYGSFGGCAGLTSVTAPRTLASIGISAFAGCSNLTAIYFQGDAPVIRRVSSVDYATIYYFPGTTGWGAFFDNRPTVLWDPQIVTNDGSFGVHSNQFGFNLTATSDLTIVVETSTSLTNPDWAPVGTNTVAGGSSYFSDPDWTSHPARIYRLRSP